MYEYTVLIYIRIYKNSVCPGLVWVQNMSTYALLSGSISSGIFWLTAPDETHGAPEVLVQ